MLKSILINTLLLVIPLFSLQLQVVGQTNESIKICEQTIKFSSSCEVNQGFQSVKNDHFDLMWLYLKNNPSIQGSSISQDKSGKINYSSNNDLDFISKNGFSIYPRKKDKVVHTPTIFNVLGSKLSGYKIKVIGKKKSLFYLTVCGEIDGNSIGFQVKLVEEANTNNELPIELKKVIKFDEEID